MTATLPPPHASGLADEAIRTTIARVLETVNALSAGGPGWTRPSYSDLESQAHAIIELEARALGLTV
ncbi:MAG: Zn-dependent hydrolase, partial [Pseudorhodobacter sp.]|nr:Zn-dependent hydrolase [Pseudorhodobacter sp.]